MSDLDAPTESRRCRPQDQWPLAIIVAIGAALRLLWLNQPMRYDESTTYLDIAAKGFKYILTEYGPNNHVLHTLLVHACTLWTSREWAIRFPALIAGIAMIPLAFAVARRLFGQGAGCIAAALVACSGHLIEYSTNARGYSMVADFSLLQVLFADRIVRSPKHRDFAAFALVTALGFFTIPTMLYPTAATLVWAMLCAVGRRKEIEWRTLLIRAAIWGACGGAMIALLYAPILLQTGGWHNLTGNRWIAPIESGWGQATMRVGGEVLREWSLGLTWPGLVVLIVAAAIAMVIGLRRRDVRGGWIVVALVVCIALMFAQRVAPFPRVFSFALPMLLLTAAGGLAMLIRTLTTQRIAAIMLCTGLAAYDVAAKTPDRSSEFDKFPQAAAVLRFVRPAVRQNDAFLCGVVASAPMRYTCLRNHMPALTYHPGVARLLLITRHDESAEHVLLANHLRPDLFRPPKLVFKKGVAEIYELIPVKGATPRPHRAPATQGADS